MSGVLDPGFRAALCKTYADLLRRQRTAASPFAQCCRATRREHEFVWLGGPPVSMNKARPGAAARSPRDCLAPSELGQSNL